MKLVKVVCRTLTQEGVSAYVLVEDIDDADDSAVDALLTAGYAQPAPTSITVVADDETDEAPLLVIGGAL